MAIFRKPPDKAAALGEIPLFHNLHDKELIEIAHHADEVAVSNGTTLTEQGASGDAFYLLVEGTAEVSRDGTVIADLGPGDSVGEMALLDGEPRSATVVMTSDGTVLTMPRQEFLGVLDEIPAIAHKLLATLSMRLREANRRLVE